MPDYASSMLVFAVHRLCIIINETSKAKALLKWQGQLLAPATSSWVCAYACEADFTEAKRHGTMM